LSLNRVHQELQARAWIKIQKEVSDIATFEGGPDHMHSSAKRKRREWAACFLGYYSVTEGHAPEHGGIGAFGYVMSQPLVFPCSMRSWTSPLLSDYPDPIIPCAACIT
jgi:hypothetical protein